MKTSFYLDLLDNFGVKINESLGPVVNDYVPAAVCTAPENSTANETYTFVNGSEDALMDAVFNKERAEAPVHENEEEDGTLSTTTSGTVSSRTVAAKSTGSGRSAARLLDNTTFSSYETKIYDGFDLMNDVVSVEFALAGDMLTEEADCYIDGYLAPNYPLAVRFNRAELANTHAKKEYPFIVITAENDYGARVCRVFLDLKRIAVAGGYSANCLIPIQKSLYCGDVGPREGQLHSWPTPESCGFVSNGKIDSERIRLVCKRIAEAIPSSRYYMDDLYADACSAEASNTSLAHEQLDVLAALCAEVEA